MTSYLFRSNDLRASDWRAASRCLCADVHALRGRGVLA